MSAGNWLVLPKRKTQLSHINGLLGHYDHGIYVGASRITKGGPKGYTVFREHVTRMTCWEINQPDAEFMREKGYFEAVECVDVANAVHEGWLANAQALFWYHGPEHLLHDKAMAVLAEMLTYEHVAIVVGCPWGRYDQSGTEDNPWNEHKCAMQPEDFASLGYEVSVCVSDGHPRSGIMAWRIPRV